MTTKYTPGPWLIEPPSRPGEGSTEGSTDWHVQDAIGNDVCTIETADWNKHEAESIACLIAAAPEMAELLTDLGRWLEAALTRGQISRSTANRDGDFVSQIRALLARIDG